MKNFLYICYLTAIFCILMRIDEINMFPWKKDISIKEGFFIYLTAIVRLIVYWVVAVDLAKRIVGI